jgi:hypothetical protein
LWDAVFITNSAGMDFKGIYLKIKKFPIFCEIRGLISMFTQDSPLVHIVSQINPIYILISYLFEIPVLIRGSYSDD